MERATTVVTARREERKAGRREERRVARREDTTARDTMVKEKCTTLRITIRTMVKARDTTTMVMVAMVAAERDGNWTKPRRTSD